MNAGRLCRVSASIARQAETVMLTHPHLEVANAPLITPPKLLPVVIKLLTRPTSRPRRFTGAASTSKTVAVVKMPVVMSVSLGDPNEAT